MATTARATILLATLAMLPTALAASLSGQAAGAESRDLPPALAPTPYSRWRDIPFWIFCLAGGAIALTDKIGRRWRLKAGA